MNSGPMLHHFVLYDQQATDQTCINGGVIDPTRGMRRIFASGNERTVDQGVPGYGVYFPSGHTFAIDHMLMNESNTSQTVQIRANITYVPGSTLKPLTPVWLDETGPCGLSFYNIGAGVTHQTMNWTSNVTGALMGLGGHLHENGVDISATDTTTNTLLCNSVESQMQMVTPLGTTTTMVTHMSSCFGTPSSPLAQIKAGDNIREVATYNTPAAQQGVMGIMIGYVAQ